MTETTQSKTQAKALGRYIRMSPRKVRRVLDQIRGKTYKEALMLLEFMPYKACGPVWQVIYSAAANAEHNLNLNKENLMEADPTSKKDYAPDIINFRELLF